MFWHTPDPTWLDLKPWLPVFVTLTAVLGAIVTYSWQRRADRLNDLYLRKRETYEAYLLAVANFVNAHEAKDKMKQNDEMKILEITLMHLVTIASDSALTEIGNMQPIMNRLHENNSLTIEDFSAFKIALAKVVIEVRRDTFGNKTGLNIDELVRLLPFDPNH